MTEALAERVLTVPEAAAHLRISERTYYEAFRRGELPGVRIGRRIVVPGPLLRDFLSGGPAVQLGEGLARTAPPLRRVEVGG